MPQPAFNRGRSMPIWVPFLLIAVSLTVIWCCVVHIGKRTKGMWPW